jgi:hypothetical protein
MTDWHQYGQAEPLRRRSYVGRMALVFSAQASFCAALVTVAVFQIVAGDSGFVVMLVVFGLSGLIVGHLASQYLRDLKAEPVVYEGPIMRRWQKGNLLIFFMPSFYVYVAGKIFSLSRAEYGGLLDEDTVRIICYPHSLTIERLERYDSYTRQFVPAVDGSIP